LSALSGEYLKTRYTKTMPGSSASTLRNGFFQVYPRESRATKAIVIITQNQVPIVKPFACVDDCCWSSGSAVPADVGTDPSSSLYLLTGISGHAHSRRLKEFREVLS